MNTAIVLAAITALATTAGGFLAIKAKDRLHLVLGLSAGLLLGLVAFDLLPEVFELGTSELLGAPAVSVALIAGFLLLHFYEQLFGSHEPAESDYGHDHKHASSVAGSLGALAMGGHVFLDGLALGVAFKVSSDLGIAVFIALLGGTSGTLLQKKFGSGVEVLSGTSWQYVATGILMGSLALIFESDQSITWNASFIFSLTWLIVALSIGAILILYFLLARSSASSVSSLYYLVPAVTAVEAYFLFGEKIGLVTAVGTLVTIAGVALVVRQRRAREVTNP